MLLKHACKMDLEGIISKRADAPYRSGRGDDWLKTKCAEQPGVRRRRLRAVRQARRALIRALVLGYYEDGKLRYAGRVGTGWGQTAGARPQRGSSRSRATTPPFDKVPPEERRRER